MADEKTEVVIPIPEPTRRPSKARKPRKVNHVATPKSHHAADKEVLYVPSDVARQIRKLRAKLELATGDRTTVGDAVAHALSKCNVK